MISGRLRTPAARQAATLWGMKIPGTLMTAAGAVILMAIVTAEALFPAAYRTGKDTISALGSTWRPGDIVREPSATIFNTTMLATGVTIAVAAVLLHRASGRRSVSIPLGLLGVGVLGVGIFRGEMIDGEPSAAGMHPVASLLAFISGALAALLTARATGRPFRYVSAVLGLVALLSLALNGPLGSTSLGEGGVERWVAYPTVLWLVAFGSYLMAGASLSAPRRPRAGRARR